MINMRIVEITGSNNPNSNTRKIVNKTLERFCSIDKMFTFEKLIESNCLLLYDKSSFNVLSLLPFFILPKTHSLSSGLDKIFNEYFI